MEPWVFQAWSPTIPQESHLTEGLGGRELPLGKTGDSHCPYLAFRCSSVTPVPLVSSWNPDLSVFGQLVQWYPHFLGGGFGGICSVSCSPTRIAFGDQDKAHYLGHLRTQDCGSVAWRDSEQNWWDGRAARPRGRFPESCLGSPASYRFRIKALRSLKCQQCYSMGQKSKCPCAPNTT